MPGDADRAAPDRQLERAGAVRLRRRPGAASRSDSASRPTTRTRCAAGRGAARGVDLLVTTGGASVGEHDLVRDVLAEHGLELDFWQIAMRPGKPLMFGRVARRPLLGLPGNPVSALVCARAVRAAPRSARCSGVIRRRRRCRRLGARSAQNDRRQDYLRAHAAWGADGRLVAMPAGRQDSSMLAAFARADCLIMRPPHAPAAALARRSRCCRCVLRRSAGMA